MPQPQCVKCYAMYYLSTAVQCCLQMSLNEITIYMAVHQNVSMWFAIIQRYGNVSKKS